MREKRTVVVVPGASSPYLEKYLPVYDLLREHGATVLDFVGCGHYSIRKKFTDCGDGFSIPAAAQKILPELRSVARGATLFCRSSGCDVVAQLMVEHPSALDVFDRVVFWGAASGLHMWKALTDQPGEIEIFNDAWESRGVLLRPDFWAHYTPIEAQCIRFACEKQVVLACGSRDENTTVKEQSYLAMLVNRHTRCKASVVEIPDAYHAVTMENITPRGLRAYQKLLCG